MFGVMFLLFDMGIKAQEKQDCARWSAQLQGGVSPELFHLTDDMKAMCPGIEKNIIKTPQK